MVIRIFAETSDADSFQNVVAYDEMRDKLVVNLKFAPSRIVKKCRGPKHVEGDACEFGSATYLFVVSTVFIERVSSHHR
jgi:hypothetical protein